MIQLATDPNASRQSSHPLQDDEGREGTAGSRSSRTGHAWPFLSRHAPSPAANDSHKRDSHNSGS